MDIKELYWAAGFIEGEGCFRKSSLRQSTAVSVAQVQREPLERVQRLFGGNINGKDAAKYNPRASYCYTWAVGGVAAVGIAMTLYPLMSTKRKRQIRETLTYWRSRPPNHKHRLVCPHGHAYTPENTVLTDGVAGYKNRECRTCRINRATLWNQKQRLKRLDATA